MLPPPYNLANSNDLDQVELTMLDTLYSWIWREGALVASGDGAGEPLD